MASIVIGNNYSCFNTNDQELRDTLWKLLRFRERGYFHSRLYKQRKWDGFRDFFSIKTGKFLTGLLPEVRLVLKQFNVQYDVVDNREDFQFHHHEIDKHFMNYGDKPIELYDYQVELVNQIIKHKRGIIFAPPGAGKTNVMCAFVKCLPPKTPTLILGNKKSLIKQNYNELTQWGIPNIGVLYDEEQSPNFITCSTIQSAHKLESILPKIKVLIVDEIHEMMSKTPMTVYRKLNSACVRVGMSGTPYKFDGKDEVQKYRVKGWIGSPFKVQAAPENKLTTKFLQDRNTLSAAKCFFYPITEPQLPYSIYLDAITEGMAESEYFNTIVARLTEKIQGRTLILVERLSHGDNLHARIPGSFWIKGEDDTTTRDHVVNYLKNYQGKVVAIATQGILNTGINVMIHNLINCAGGKADHQIIQRIGRGLRTADDKETLNYYDWIFKINPYLNNHSEKRIKILRKLGLEIIIKDEIDF